MCWSLLAACNVRAQGYNIFGTGAQLWCFNFQSESRGDSAYHALLGDWVEDPRKLPRGRTTRWLSGFRVLVSVQMLKAVKRF